MYNSSIRPKQHPGNFYVESLCFTTMLDRTIPWPKGKYTNVMEDLEHLPCDFHIFRPRKKCFFKILWKNSPVSSYKDSMRSLYSSGMCINLCIKGRFIMDGCIVRTYDQNLGASVSDRINIWLFAIQGVSLRLGYGLTRIFWVKVELQC